MKNASPEIDAYIARAAGFAQPILRIAEAKHEEIRQRRLSTAIAWISRGKPRNWKYMKK